MKIEIKGPIISDGQAWIYDWLEMPYSSPSKVNKLINQAKDGEDLEIEINSPGGIVSAGSEIYTLLKSYKGNVKGKIIGLAASAASVIAMGIKDLSISPTASIMIHKASVYGGTGNAEDFQKKVNMLNSTDKSIVNAYILKTGLKQEELLRMMSEETWLDADKAKKMGFVDSIMFQEEQQAVASFENNGMIPEKIINKLMEEFKNKAEIENELSQKELRNQNKIELAKAKLQLQIIM